MGFYLDIQHVLSYNYLQALSLTLLFFSLSSCPLCSFLHPADTDLVTDKQKYSWDPHKIKEGKGDKRPPSPRKCHTFPTLSLFPQFSVSEFWYHPPALWFALCSPPSHPIKCFSPGLVILLQPAPPNRPEAFLIFMRNFNLSWHRLGYPYGNI